MSKTQVNSLCDKLPPTLVGRDGYQARQAIRETHQASLAVRLGVTPTLWSAEMDTRQADIGTGLT
ncbi:MAG: hypothetical protein ANABAC_0162 [Anaerolineae bacterium]|nr:MAG: hypothetical protein ANABAC_0162 [Anaerolineae bacterium]